MCRRPSLSIFHASFSYIYPLYVLYIGHFVWIMITIPLLTLTLTLTLTALYIPTITNRYFMLHFDIYPSPTLYLCSYLLIYVSIVCISWYFIHISPYVYTIILFIRNVLYMPTITNRYFMLHFDMYPSSTLYYVHIHSEGSDGAPSSR